MNEANQKTRRMKHASQSQMEADRPMVDFLKPKKKMRVACWNVRTLYQTGKLAQVVREFDNYYLDILGISEVRRRGTSKRQLASGHTILYSERTNNQHAERVAIIYGSKLENTLIEWKHVGARIITARFNSRYIKLTILLCYAPIEDAEKWDKEAFYNKLQEAIQRVPTHDMLLVMGDLNARVGNDNTGRESNMGTHGCGIMNNNGQHLCELCKENKLVIGGLFFQHKEIHKKTWTSLDGVTISQIDHILVNRKWRSSLQDVRTRRRADVTKDHNLVTGTVTLKLQKTKRGQAA